MLLQISPSDQHAFQERLTEMHFQRGRVFKGRLDWAVNVRNGQEFDEYDGLGPTYLLYVGHDGIMKGSIRLLPTSSTNMLCDTFPQLLSGNPAPNSPQIWESSRFCVETENDEKGKNKLSRGCIELFAGMVEFGLSRGLTSIATVTDIRVERILKIAGWEVSRIGEAQKVGNTDAVALDMPCTMKNLISIRKKSGFLQPVLWTLPTGHQTAPQMETLGEAQNIHGAITFLRKQAEELGLHDVANQLGAAQGGIHNAMLHNASPVGHG